MNPIFRAAGETAAMGWLMGIMTIVFLVIFVGWTWWAYSPANRENMKRWSRLPLDDTE